jgi:hypothetical protein
VGPDHAEVVADHYLCPAASIACSRLEDGVITATAPLDGTWRRGTGTDRLVIDDYDAFVFAGFGTYALRHLAILKQHTVLDGRPDGGGFLPLRRRYPMSQAALAATIADRLRRTRAFQYARAIRARTDRPMFWIPTPRTSARWIGSTAPAWFRRRVNDAEIDALFQATDRAVADCTAEVGATLLAQPAETLAGPRYTVESFLRDNDSSRVGKSGIDLNHMNGAFGTLVWRAHVDGIVAAARECDRLRAGSPAVVDTINALAGQAPPPAG